MPDRWNGIHRQHVHGVHQENPDKHGQRQRRHQFTAGGVVNHALGLVFNHFGQNFDGGLEAARHAGSCLAGSAPQKEAGNHAQQDRVKNRVKVEDAKVDDAGLLDTGEGKILLQMLQVMLDVLSRRLGSFSVFSSHKSPVNQFSKFLDRLLARRAQPHGSPVHLHRHHKTSQQSQPTQFIHQPWRSKQHCHRQGYLDHLPDKKPG